MLPELIMRWPLMGTALTSDQIRQLLRLYRLETDHSQF